MDSKSLLGALFDEMYSAGVEEHEITHVQNIDGIYSGDFDTFKRIIKDSPIDSNDPYNFLCQSIAVIAEDCYFSFNRFAGKWETFDLPCPVIDFPRSLESFLNDDIKGLTKWLNGR